MSSYAKVILDSISLEGKRLVTLETRYWRAIHSEIMTHRDRARNAASSRAIPFIRYDKDGHIVANCTYSYIKNDGFVPQFIGSEQKGMQSGIELSGPERFKAEDIIEDMKDYCLRRCTELYDLGVHKSIINRYLEPWSYITVVMTATEWKNFFRLRIHPKAEKHFNQIATLMKQAMDTSTPVQREWHLPYIQQDDLESEQWSDLLDKPLYSFYGRDLTTVPEALNLLKRISAARCARVSYLTHDGKRDLTEDLRLFDTLMQSDNVVHASPLEHVAQAYPGRSGPYNGWKQFRKEFVDENVQG